MSFSNRADLLDGRIARIYRILRKDESRLSLLSGLRILSFLSFLGWILAVYLLRTGSEIHYLPSLLILTLFYRLLSLYQKRREKIRRLGVWIGFLENQKARFLLESKGYPKAKREYYKNLLVENQTPPWTKDLDFLGEKGLFSRMDTTVTQKGSSLFLDYFFQAPSEEELRKRQSSIFTLVQRSGRTQKLLRKLRLYEASFPERKEGNEEKLPSYIPDLSSLLGKEGGSDAKLDSPFRIFREAPSEFWNSAFGKSGFTIRFLFPVWVLAIWIFAIASLLFAQTWVAGLFLLNFAFFGFYRSDSLRMIGPLSEDSETLEELGKILRFIRGSKIPGVKKDEYLKEWPDAELKASWKQLEKIANLAAYSQSPLAHGLLNVLFCFDLWIWRRYANWWNHWGERILSAFEDLCELDSLLPLANLHFIEPDFSFPIFNNDNEASIISAKNLIHPLIPAGKRVPNDLEPILPGRLLLLTGSNMSGKTTYLRAVGICGVLAMAGAPVPASEFRTPFLDVHSSIRNEDSVDEGVSFFYAEVKRLGKILQDVVGRDRKHLVLLDEILKGTNSRERTIACKGILKKLSEFRAFGIITTHDLELAGLDNLVLYHFREEIRNGRMSFDYKIREGVVQSSNALEVLKLEGLDLE